MPSTADGREANDTLWFTVREAADFLGRNVQTIYSWERRGHLNQQASHQDEHGRRIYSQPQLAAAERLARHNAARVRHVAAT